MKFKKSYASCFWKVPNLKWPQPDGEIGLRAVSDFSRKCRRIGKFNCQKTQDNKNTTFITSHLPELTLVILRVHCELLNSD